MPRIVDEARLRELWAHVENRWDTMPVESKLDLPWVKTRFMLDTFRVTLAQVIEEAPVELGGPV